MCSGPMPAGALDEEYNNFSMNVHSICDTNNKDNHKDDQNFYHDLVGYSKAWAKLTTPKLTSAEKSGAEDAYGHIDIFPVRIRLVKALSHK
uniref:Uncharacterized protein n=1 Tax=Romanomermis culicivorax TaxID=13658 RepID=A0A915I5G9_ROMCU